jgi:DNA-binding GntR family transcriptional regulator
MTLLNFKQKFIPQYSSPLVEQITEFLTDAIMEGRLGSGQRLVENELQRVFGVSRGSIRESFRILEKNGLVVITPRKGTYIREVTQKAVTENFPIRAILESLAASLAVPNITSEHIKGMELALSGMARSAKKNDFRSYLKHHSQYHEIFIKASNNDTIISIIENLRRQAIFFRISYLYVQENVKYNLQVHRKILDLFIKKDSDKVESLVKEHILIALNNFIKFLENKEITEI